MRHARRAVAATIILGSLTAHAGAQQPLSPPADPRGIFVYSWNIAVTQMPVPHSHPDPNFAKALVDAVSSQGADGITLVQNWSAIETARGVYQWDSTGTTCASAPLSLLDEWMCWASASGKKVNLAIRAGEDTPAWLFVDDGHAGTLVAKPLDFQVTPHQGLNGVDCTPVRMAAPWDPAFLVEWASMLDALATHLADMGTYDAIAQLRLTGINRTTDEFRLPEEILTCPNQTVQSNAVDTWLYQADPPYRPSRLLEAWVAITAAFRSSFPDTFVNVPIIPPNIGAGTSTTNQYPFPPIDENGCVYRLQVPADAIWTTPPCFNGAQKIPDPNTPLLRLASRRFPGRLTVEFENLDLGKPVSSEVIRAADRLRTGAAFMTNDYFGQTHAGNATACSGGTLLPVACTEQEYQQLLDQGIYPKGPTDVLRAQFLEVFHPEVSNFPNDIQHTHAELMAPPFVALSFPPVPPTGWFTGPVTGMLTATPAAGQVMDDASIACIKGTASVSGSISVQVSRQGNPTRVFCTAADLAGNVGLSIGYALPIDTKPPTTTASIVTFPNGGTQVVFSAYDYLSVVATTEFSFDRGHVWWNGTRATSPTAGTFHILFRSTDVAGNVEKPKGITVTFTGIQPPCTGRCS